ncbi:MAG: monofunctional biosynthetic peptidoglycan transglycosylase [Ignavibacteriae bacterium]|nr:monofunctional biosynthetic peptidoglycan transglycosylase [Ignavibacteriota bacterium]
MLKKIWKVFFSFILFYFVTTILTVGIFRFLPIPTSSFMTQQRISNIINENFEPLIYDWVDYDEISNSAKLAVIAAEDQKFFNHFGFDLQSIEKALKRNKNSKITRGASTITQQTAKNLFLWSDKSFIRKGLEVYFTLLLELIWSKERILEVYLNIAEFGENVYGVQSAAKKYFKRNANQLTNKNSAMLAAVLPNPKKYKVNTLTNYRQRRVLWIQRQMRQLGKGILEEQSKVKIR